MCYIRCGLSNVEKERTTTVVGRKKKNGVKRTNGATREDVEVRVSAGVVSMDRETKLKIRCRRNPTIKVWVETRWGRLCRRRRGRNVRMNIVYAPRPSKFQRPESNR